MSSLIFFLELFIAGEGFSEQSLLVPHSSSIDVNLPSKKEITGTRLQSRQLFSSLTSSENFASISVDGSYGSNSLAIEKTTEVKHTAIYLSSITASVVTVENNSLVLKEGISEQSPGTVFSRFKS